MADIQDKPRVGAGVPTGGQFMATNRPKIIQSADEWAVAGFHEVAAKRWQDADLSIEEALLWRDNGVSIRDAAVLRDVPIDEAVEWLEHGFKADEIVLYKRNNISIKGATLWKKYIFDAESVEVWSACGVSPLEADYYSKKNIKPLQLQEWLVEGYPFDYAIGRCKAGMSLLDEAERWNKLGFRKEKVDRYMAIGVFDPNVAAEWDSLPNDGLHYAEKWAEYHTSPREVAEWIETGLDLFQDDIEWHNVGVSPSEALEWYNLKLTPEDFIKWHDTFPEAREVFACKCLRLTTPEEALAAIPPNITPYEALEWHISGTELDMILFWKEAGYTSETIEDYYREKEEEDD
jgi:hypothetical protein